jgi:uncharacterized protein YodC (DUF2158 family)
MKFKGGDLEKLKSGGPVMTVEQVGKTAMLQEEAVVRMVREGRQQAGCSTGHFRPGPA